jgi:hypothetical protein
MFVTCSKNGSITSQLLTNMLSKMDDYRLFDRSNGTNPILAMLRAPQLVRGTVSGI